MSAGERAKPNSAEHAKASVKEAIGKLTGDARVEAEGKAEKRRAPRSRAAPHDD